MYQDRMPNTPAATIPARSLLRSNPVLETLSAALKSHPLAVLKVLGLRLLRRESLAHLMANHLPFNASALLYDQRALEAVRHREKTIAAALHADLPAPWTKAIAAHLDLAVALEGTGSDRPARPDGTGIAAVAQSDAQTEPHTAPADNQGFLTTMRIVARAIRLYQWPKNALVFLPILLSHRIDELPLLLNFCIAFVCMGLVASSIYVLNDIMDLQQDRKHPSKCRRPFASGALSAGHGLILMPLLLGAGFGLSLLLPPLFPLALAAYLVLNLFYTLYLKRKLLVDVLALAGAYTLRILAGNAAGPIELSFWLLAFSIFLFFSLALVKRYVELDTVGAEARNEKRVMGRGYRYSDLDMLSQLGIASAFSAVLVLALYVEKAGQTGLYKTPELIWLICPIVLYVIGRIWVLAKRREMPDDPVHFILRDWRSHLMGAIIAVVMVAAAWPL